MSADTVGRMLGTDWSRAYLRQSPAGPRAVPEAGGEPPPVRVTADNGGALDAADPAPAEWVSIALLWIDGSPRIDGEDEQHTQALAETESELPPILVHRATMRVLDGVHRVRAACLKGQDSIAAIFFDGDDRAAFVKAVEANITHGLPLTMADRRAAAERIIAAYSEWSDRAVAASTGLSPSSVRLIRAGLAGESTDQGTTRLGRDGRARPLDAAVGRQRAATVIAARPEASLREIASSAGVSLGTARDVRRRLQNGQDPVPSGARRNGAPDAARARSSTPHKLLRDLHRLAAESGHKAPSTLLQRLKSDPALRYTDAGRRVLRWLDAHVVDSAEWSSLAQSVPPHSAYALAELAIGCATEWQRLASELCARIEDSPEMKG